MLTSRSLPMQGVVGQHAADCGVLCSTRAALVSAPHVKLTHLARLDERLAAHFDGLRIAGRIGTQLCEEALANSGFGEAVAAAVLAIENGDIQGVNRILALAETMTDLQPAVVAAVGWVSAESLREIIRGLLAAPSAFRRTVGIAALQAHRAHAGEAASAAMTDANTLQRLWGFRAAGACGSRDLLGDCLVGLNDASPACRYSAARSAVLLGDRAKSLEALEQAALVVGPDRPHALATLLRSIRPAQTTVILRAFSRDTSDMRTLMRAVGVAGDCHYVPWLIGQMADLKFARLAGESFSTITGVDLALLDLERKPPEGIEFGPNDNPDDVNVAMDEDEGLCWADPLRVQTWWTANAHRFQPGVRYFMGAPPSWEHCLQVLKDGYQRQRIASAEYLCLLRPGTMLFNCEAPAWRQQRWLTHMQ